MSEKKTAKVISLAKKRTRWDELAALAARGRLKAEEVVRFARNPATRLHKSFEWNDTKAAAAYRIEQAREIIQAFVVVISGPRGPLRIRALHSLPSDRASGGGYRRVQDIVKDKALVAELLDSALADLTIFKERYEFLAQLSPVWRAADRIRAKAGLRARRAA